MTEKENRELRRLFDLVIDTPAESREKLLSRECAGDAGLRSRIMAMVAAAEDDRFLGEATENSEAVSHDAATKLTMVHERPGTRIGPYKLLQLIGEGGFGSVFMAEQEKPVQRKVALKIIKVGMDTHQVVARFEQERQALAMMDHPHIARVLDAGATETGRPYFVMDLVKGDPISEYCDKQNLSIEERLAIFEQVCGAVQHAHTKGIIHRDIKPSNILVSTIDGRPVAKVIDFGIAKATASKLTEKTLFTEHRQLIGTPEYMSPEQAEGSLDIDTRTDVYSLGVLLYELLTGSTPFDSKTLRRAAFGEIQRIIREVDPPKPSTRLNQSAETLQTVAMKRRSEPKRLGALVRGELDWIAMKALEKDRNRRYESASSLARDIERYLKGEAVTAAPPSRAYRLKKLIRRNRSAAITIGAVTVALLIGIVGFAWQAQRTAAQRDVALAAQRSERAARELADTERSKSEAISQFIQAALNTSDPNQGGSQGMMVGDAMLQSARELDAGKFKDQPEIEAALRMTISTILNGNGRATEALPMAERALAICRRLHAGDHPDTAAALNNLGLVLHSVGRSMEAEQVLIQALEMRKRLYPGDHADVATSLDNLGTELDALGKNIESEPMYAQALEMRKRLFPGDHPDVALSLANVAFSKHARGYYTEAEDLYRKSLEMRQRIFKGDHPQVAASLNSLAYVLQDQKHSDQAEVIFRQTLEMYQRIFKGDHPEVAMALNNLGFVMKSEGKLAEAEDLLSRSAEMSQRLYPGDHPNVAMSLETLADIRSEMGKTAEAEPIYVRCVEMNKRIYKGQDNLLFAKSMTSLARAWHTLGRKEESERMMDETLGMLRRMPSEEAGLSLARTLWRSGGMRMKDGNPAGALPRLEEAVRIAEPLSADDSEELAEYRKTLAACKEAIAK